MPSSRRALASTLATLRMEMQFLLLCLPAIGQEHVLSMAPEGAGSAVLHNIAIMMTVLEFLLDKGQCYAEEGERRAALADLAQALERVEKFYDSIGGLVGYQRKCLELIHDNREPVSSTLSPAEPEVVMHMPQGPDLAGFDGRQLAAEAAAGGLDALPNLAEIWPLGGATLSLCNV